VADTLLVFYQVSSLEVLSRQHEEVIKERETTVSTLQNELDRQSQIAAMIHKLTMEQQANNNKSTSSTEVRRIRLSLTPT
jgi:hypothetical protein